MSSQTKKIAKNSGKLGGGLSFPIEMYNTPVGSVVICCLMLSKNYDKKAIRHKWTEYKAKVRKGEEIFDLNSPEFIDKVLEYFGLKRPKYFPIAMVISPYNTLFALYDKRRKMLLPLREDGFSGPTLRYGKIYPIVFNKKVAYNRIWLKEKLRKLFRVSKKVDSKNKEKVDVALQGK